MKIYIFTFILLILNLEGTLKAEEFDVSAMLKMPLEERLKYVTITQSAAVTSVKKQLPKKIDDMTILVNISSSGPELTYHYEFSLNKGKLKSEIVLNYFSKSLKKDICLNEFMVVAMKIGAIYRYSYIWSDKSEIGDIVIKENDCK